MCNDRKYFRVPGDDENMSEFSVATLAPMPWRYAWASVPALMKRARCFGPVLMIRMSSARVRGVLWSWGLCVVSPILLRCAVESIRGRMMTAMIVIQKVNLAGSPFYLGKVSLILQQIVCRGSRRPYSRPCQGGMPSLWRCGQNMSRWQW